MCHGSSLGHHLQAVRADVLAAPPSRESRRLLDCHVAEESRALGHGGSSTRPWCNTVERLAGDGAVRGDAPPSRGNMARANRHMSRALYDFLNDSLLFDDQALTSGFDEVSAADLEHVLDDYSAYVTKPEVASLGVARPDKQFGILYDGSGGVRPGSEELKRSLLYFDRIIIDDPLYAICQERAQSAGPFAHTAALPREGVPRNRIAAAAKYMKAVAPLVAAEVVELLPLQMPATPPKLLLTSLRFDDLPLGIPKDLGEWFLKRARIRCLRLNESGDLVPVEPGTPTRHVHIAFEGHQQQALMVLLQSEVERTEVKDGVGTATVISYLPTSPPRQGEFRAWLRDASYQAGGILANVINNEVRVAQRLNALLMTDSDLVSEFLAMRSAHGPSLPDDLARLQLSVELPVLTDVGFDTLIAIRQTEGEALESFRVYMRKKLVALRSITDPSALKSRLDEVQHELLETDVATFEQLKRRVARDLNRKAVFGFATLAVAVAAGTSTLGGVFLAAAAAGLALERRGDELGGHPAYLMWKLKAEAERRRKSS